MPQSFLWFHPGRPGQKPGYTMDVFDAIGETVDVLTGSEPQIEPPTVERAFEN